jgi:hypothetical protein
VYTEKALPSPLPCGGVGGRASTGSFYLLAMNLVTVLKHLRLGLRPLHIPHLRYFTLRFGILRFNHFNHFTHCFIETLHIMTVIVELLKKVSWI